MRWEIKNKFFTPFCSSIFIHSSLIFIFFLLNAKAKEQKVFEISFLDNSLKKAGEGYSSFHSDVSQSISPNNEIASNNSNDIVEDGDIKLANNEAYASNGDRGLGDSFYTLSHGPKIVGKFSPKYPLLARRMGKNGQVKVEVFIDENGNLLSFSILESSGKEFSESVEEELKKTTFYPALINGVPVKSRGILPIRFEINDAS